MFRRRGRRWLIALWIALALSVAATACDRGGGPSEAPTETGVRIVRDVEYANHGGLTLLMDIYVPTGDGPHPAVEAIHGGGFIGGDRSQMRGVCLYLADSGYVAFSIDYRLAPGAAFPDQVDDARAAIDYVRAHAGELGVDAGRIAVLGSSAGGTIGATLAGLDSGGGGGPVAAVITWSGALDLPALAAEGSVTAELGLERYVGVSDLSSPAATPLLAEASPVRYVDQDYPPTFIANSKDELMPFGQALSMAQALQADGVEHVLFVPAGGHGLDYAREASPPTVRFLDTYVGR